MNQLDFIRNNLYTLKHDYGQSVDFYKVKTTVNLETGKRVLVRQKATVDLVIVLPSLENMVGKSLSFLQTGGDIDVADRIIIVDPDDLPRGWIIDIDDYLIIDNIHRYQIKKIADYGQGVVVSLKETKGAELSRLLDNRIREKIRLTQTLIKV